MAIIYEPRGQAREYAPLACNVYRGCGHGCRYCYAPSATFRSREEFAIPEPRRDFLPKLRREAEQYQHAGITKQVLLSFTCDPYQPMDVQHQITRRTISILHAHGFTVQILTKGGTRALRDVDLLGPGDAFATTMTLLDPGRSQEWEPYAALPDDRITAIRAMRQAGIPTWISLEPVLDPATALAIIRKTYTIVDLYKVGKLNYADRLPDHLRCQVSGIDWYRFAQDVVSLLNRVNVRYYIKDSLRPYLPTGLVPEQDPDDYQLGSIEGGVPAPKPVQNTLF